MENKLAIILIVLLFIGIGAYTYGAEVMERRKEKRQEKERLKNEKLMFQKKVEIQKMRDEKERRFRERSEDIKRELKALEKAKSKGT